MTRSRLGRQYYCGEPNNDGINVSCPGLSVDSTGSGNFKITIPNWARSGVQELKVFGCSDDDSGSQNVTIGGPQIHDYARDGSGQPAGQLDRHGLQLQ